MREISVGRDRCRPGRCRAGAARLEELQEDREGAVDDGGEGHAVLLVLELILARQYAQRKQ